MRLLNQNVHTPHREQSKRDAFTFRQILVIMLILLPKLREHAVNHPLLKVALVSKVFRWEYQSVKSRGRESSPAIAKQQLKIGRTIIISEKSGR